MKKNLIFEFLSEYFLEKWVRDKVVVKTCEKIIDILEFLGDYFLEKSKWHIYIYLL